MIKRDDLKQIIADQANWQPPKFFFERDLVEVIEEFVQDPNILILSGIRRCGKSTIQRIFQDGLLESPCYFNFDDERLIHFQVEDFQALLEVFIELSGKQSTFYFDEIQNVPGWERFVRRLYEQGYKVFITGSNANLLSVELGTHLTGRYIQFEVFPLSFREILRHRYPVFLEKRIFSTEEKGLILKSFSDYLSYGGIPEYYKRHKLEYLKSLYEGILYRDIIARYHIPSEKPLQQLIFYFASNIGKEFSYSKLAEIIGVSSGNTVSDYCNYLESAYLCFFLKRYNHSLKKQIQYNKKCYMIDTALIQTIGFRVSEDRGRLLENIVYLELRRHFQDIYFHKEQKECDFLIRKKNQVIQAIQVTLHLNDEKTRFRELEGLLEAIKTYNLKEGLILTEAGQEETLVVEGYNITLMPLWKWLIFTYNKDNADSSHIVS